MTIYRSALTVFTFTALALALSACGNSGLKTEAKYPTGVDRNITGNNIYDDAPSIFGDEGLSIGGDRKKEDGSSMTVNAYLWRAALDTVSFMPLSSADPFGGTILTDWYTPDESKGERFKLNVFILSKQLRSDGIQVRVFKQVAEKKGWVDAPPSAEMARNLEDAILVRARQLRVGQLGE